MSELTPKDKVLHLQISTCDECPYCQYNGDYGRSYDSGMDCKHPKTEDRRIVNEGGYDRINNNSMYLEIARGMPDWCPLENDPEYN